MRRLFDVLSQVHHLVVAVGVGTWQEPLAPLVWMPLEEGSAVLPMRPVGRPGGVSGCPSVRLLNADAGAWAAFRLSMEATLRVE